MAVAAKSKDKAAEKPAGKKDKQDKKDKQAKSSGSKPPAGGEGAAGLSLAAHPRAVRRVAEAKAWGGLAGFLLGGYLSLPTHSAFEAALRALLAGVVCHVVSGPPRSSSGGAWSWPSCVRPNTSC